MFVRSKWWSIISTTHEKRSVERHRVVHNNTSNFITLSPHGSSGLRILSSLETLLPSGSCISKCSSYHWLDPITSSHVQPNTIPRHTQELLSNRLEKCTLLLRHITVQVTAKWSQPRKREKKNDPIWFTPTNKNALSHITVPKRNRFANNESTYYIAVNDQINNFSSYGRHSVLHICSNTKLVDISVYLVIIIVTAKEAIWLYGTINLTDTLSSSIKEFQINRSSQEYHQWEQRKFKQRIHVHSPNIQSDGINLRPQITNKTQQPPHGIKFRVFNINRISIGKELFSFHHSHTANHNLNHCHSTDTVLITRISIHGHPQGIQLAEIHLSQGWRIIKHSIATISR